MSYKTIQPSAPIAVLTNRLKWHLDPENAAGILHGMNFFDVPTWRIEGRDDLPNICFIDYTDNETAFKGEVLGPYPNANVNIEPIQTATLLLTTNRDFGLFTINPVPNGARSLVDWIALIRDAAELEYSPDPDNDQADDRGFITDSRLCGTMERPLWSRVRENVVTETCWCCGIEFVLYPRATIRGTRNDLMSLEYGSNPSD